MRIALIGATGNAGTRILNELVSRGHLVTGIARYPEKLQSNPSVFPKKTDGSGPSITAAVRGHDAVISSVRFVDLDPDILVPAIRDSGVKRYLVVGGAGSLLRPDGIEEAEAPEFPEPFRANSRRGSYLLELLRASDDLDWTFISPSRFFRPGERTGTFRYGKDHLLMDEAGTSAISFEDFAVAMADELQRPKHIRERFTVGY